MKSFLPKRSLAIPDFLQDLGVRTELECSYINNGCKRYVKTSLTNLVLIILSSSLTWLDDQGLEFYFSLAPSASRE